MQEHNIHIIIHALKICHHRFCNCRENGIFTQNSKEILMKLDELTVLIEL